MFVLFFSRSVQLTHTFRVSFWCFLLEVVLQKLDYGLEYVSFFQSPRISQPFYLRELSPCLCSSGLQKGHIISVSLVFFVCSFLSPVVPYYRRGLLFVFQSQRMEGRNIGRILRNIFSSCIKPMPYSCREFHLLFQQARLKNFTFAVNSFFSISPYEKPHNLCEFWCFFQSVRRNRPRNQYQIWSFFSIGAYN